MNPDNDGVDHINIYSQAKTTLGRFLTNFTHTPFNHPEDGNFCSIEGYWYWLSCKDDKLRTLSGFKAKEYGRSIGAKDWQDDEEFKRKIKLAILIKIQSNEMFKQELHNLRLPLTHYYNYGGKIVEPKEGRWIIEYLESFKKQIKYKVVGADTDAVWFTKETEEPFNEEEIKEFIAKINTIFPENIKFDMDGYFPKFIILKTKNYIMYDGKNIKLKGSSLKSSTLEPALKSMLKEMIEALVFDRKHDLIDIYNKYIKDACNITDMKPWAKKISISTATIESERSNETRVIDALTRSNKPISEGDRHYIFFKTDKEMELCENFNGEYHLDAFLKKIYSTTERFETILPIKEMFPKYHNVGNKQALFELVGDEKLLKYIKQKRTRQTKTDSGIIESDV